MHGVYRFFLYKGAVGDFPYANFLPMVARAHSSRVLCEVYIAGPSDDDDFEFEDTTTLTPPKYSRHTSTTTPSPAA